MRHIGKFFFLAVLMVFLISCASNKPGPTTAGVSQEQLEAQHLVDNAQFTFNDFMADSTMGGMRALLKDAKGVFIVPQEIKGAFIVGASGGSGVLVQRVGNTNDWSGPAFYTTGGASFGLQIGGQAAGIVLLIMSDRGIAAFMSNNFKLGADAGIAVGPVGLGAATSTANLSADIISFAKAKGLYGGISLDGAVVATRDKWNHAYYRKSVTPIEILGKDYKTAHSAGLLHAVAAASQEKTKQMGEAGSAAQEMK